MTRYPKGSKTSKCPRSSRNYRAVTHWSQMVAVLSHISWTQPKAVVTVGNTLSDLITKDIVISDVLIEKKKDLIKNLNNHKFLNHLKTRPFFNTAPCPFKSEEKTMFLELKALKIKTLLSASHSFSFFVQISAFSFLWPNLAFEEYYFSTQCDSA